MKDSKIHLIFYYALLSTIHNHIHLFGVAEQPISAISLVSTVAWEAEWKILMTGLKMVSKTNISI